MKKILSVLLFLGLVGSNLLAVDSNQMIIISTDDSQTAYVISTIKKITFESGVMTLHNTSSNSNHNLLTTKKIIFSLVNTADKNTITEDLNVTVYPNPVEKTINLSGNIDQKSVHIYSIHGERFETNKNSYNGITTINVSSFPKGIYILQIGNQSIKFTKK